MDLLTFSQLVVQLLRHKDTLAQHGFMIDLHTNSNNLYQDELIVKKKIHFKEYFFTTQPCLWDTRKEFCFYSNNNYQQLRYTYHINKSTSIPEPSQIGQEMPPDLVPFANDVFQILQVIDGQLKHDRSRLNLNNSTVNFSFNGGIAVGKKFNWGNWGTGGNSMKF